MTAPVYSCATSCVAFSASFKRPGRAFCNDLFLSLSWFVGHHAHSTGCVIVSLETQCIRTVRFISLQGAIHSQRSFLDVFVSLSSLLTASILRSLSTTLLFRRNLNQNIIATSCRTSLVQFLLCSICSCRRTFATFMSPAVVTASLVQVPCVIILYRLRLPVHGSPWHRVRGHQTHNALMLPPASRCKAPVCFSGLSVSKFASRFFPSILALDSSRLFTSRVASARRHPPSTHLDFPSRVASAR